MSVVKPWLGRITYNPDGIIAEQKFEDEQQADAFVKGFYAAKEIATEGDDVLDDYDAHYLHESKDEAVDE
jgi:hypothetical protein